MKKITLLSIIAISSFQFVSATLPPFYQSVSEYEAIIQSEELHEQLGTEHVIRGIHRTPEGGYIIITQKKTLYVEVVYNPTEVVGSANFELKFSDLSSLNPDHCY